MKRKFAVVSAVVVALIASSSPLQAACRVQRVRNVRHHHVAETKIAVPFAVPVAVPVAVVSPYFYGYSQFAPQSSSRSHAPAWERNAPTLRVDELQIDPANSNPRRKASAQAFPRGAWEREGSLVAQHCVTCHGGASPQGQLSLERVDRLTLADRLAAIRAVLTRRMPKGAKLDDEQMRGIVDELTTATD